jgi:FAD/FMN-containing dehydrogenase
VLLYVKPTTLRESANGYAVVTSRANIQRVVNEFVTQFQTRLHAYQAEGRYPVNGPVEIRVTGLDIPGDVSGLRAVAPRLSALRPRPDHPAWDVAVWLDILTLPPTPHADEFYRDIEAWIFATYTGTYASVRPEWSKGWAYTASGAWTDPTVLKAIIPHAYRSGHAAGDNWDEAVRALNALDPHRIFTNPLLDTLLV